MMEPTVAESPSSVATDAQTSPPNPWREFRRELHRSETDRVLTGVAGGLATTLGIPSAYVRAGFIVLTFTGGVGVVLYIVLWALARHDVRDEEPRQLEERQVLAVAVIYLGLLLALRGLDMWFGDALVWSAALVSFGTAAIWDRRPARIGADGTLRAPKRGRAIFGAVLMLGGLIIVFSSIGALSDLGPIVIAIAVTAAGFMLVFGPWVFQITSQLRTERYNRIRTEERAEVAAHLHDSVLQTLALIQRTDDRKRMVTLARAQERELRAWLYGDASAEDVATLRPAVELAAARVEEDHNVPIEVVIVGDRNLDPDITALVAATGEAMTNAAKHSGATKVSLYAEVGQETIDVYVSDQGNGFDPSQVNHDRRGIADSMVARMERHGGAATVTSEPGEGTEAHLSLPISGVDSD